MTDIKKRIEAWKTDFKCAKMLHNMPEGYFIINKQSKVTWDGVNLVDAMEKAKAKPPIKRDGWYCPNCQELLASEISYGLWMQETDGDEYCPDCGQHIRWTK